MRTLSLLLPIVLLVFSCNNDSQLETDGHWITGEEDMKIQKIETHFRGLDVAMIETGYRYNELYWAGKSHNWEYASYQIEKIEHTLTLALERRPQRAASATHFLTYSIPDVKKSIQQQDTIEFNRAYDALTINCNACHAAEKVSYFRVAPPTLKTSPIQ